MVSWVSSIFGSLLLCRLAFAMTCEKAADGSITFVENNEVVEPEPFDCIVVSEPKSTRTVTYLDNDSEGNKICQINDDGVPKDRKIYSPSAVSTGTLCEYTCKESTGLFRCSVPTQATDNACACEDMPNRVHIRKVSTEIGGQNDVREETEKTCTGKPEGYQFADPVPCTSLQADVKKLRVHYVNEPGMCRTDNILQPETRYTPASEDDFSLQGCIYVCRHASPTCTEQESGSLCKCRSPGMVKRLVPLDGIVAREVMDQTNCNLRQGRKCGPCASCNEKTGMCDLHPNASEGEFCECGEICPRTDLRSADKRYGKVNCRPNLALDCMKRPGWLGSSVNRFELGTKFPNLCVKGKVNRMDTCECKSGYTEKPGPFSAIYCTRE